EELALAEDLDQLGPQPGPGALEPLRGRPAGGEQRDDPLRPLPGQGDGEERQHGTDGELHRTSSWPGRVRWPCRSLPLGNIRRRVGGADTRSSTRRPTVPP